MAVGQQAMLLLSAVRKEGQSVQGKVAVSVCQKGIVRRVMKKTVKSVHLRKELQSVPIRSDLASVRRQEIRLNVVSLIAFLVHHRKERQCVKIGAIVSVCRMGIVGLVITKIVSPVRVVKHQPVRVIMEIAPAVKVKT